MSRSTHSIPNTQVPTVLAVDASSGWCSAALLHLGALQCIVEPIGHGHSRRLLPMVDELLAQHRLRPADCDAFAFGAGPGAFTGLRIACGLVQGLGFATRRPVVPVDCLAATALHARRVVGLAGRRAADVAVAVAIDARMDEVYFGLDDDTGQGSLARTFGVGPAERAARVLGDAWRAGPVQDRRARDQGRLICAGDGFERYRELLAPLAAGAHAVLEQAHARADAIALLGAEALATGQDFAAARAAPRYVRDKVALDVDEQHALRAARAARTIA